MTSSPVLLPVWLQPAAATIAVPSISAEQQRVRVLRQQMFANGFRYVAVNKRKQALEDGWGDKARALTAEAIEQHIPDPGLLNTGILCDGLLGVDIDVDDAATVDQVRSLARLHLGGGPERSRENTDRTLLLYRAADDLPRTPDLVGTENRGRIQLLGQGMKVAEPPARQFVADGVLEDGSRYRWNHSPNQFSRNQLTVVSADALSAFLAESAPLIGAERPAILGIVPGSIMGQGPSSQTSQQPTADDLDYFWKPFERQREAYRALTEGRNLALCKLAKYAGNFIPNFGLNHKELARELFNDAVANGYVAMHDAATARTTIQHNLREGATEPRELPSAKRAALTAGVDFGGLYSEQPRPLRRRFVEGNQFPIHALGNTLQWAADAIADKIQCPLGMAAMSVLGAASLVVQSHGDVVLPASGQTKPLSLFLVSIGESGERKSAADGEALRAVRLREKELTEVHDKELASYRNNHDAWEAARARILKGKAEHPLEIAGQLARIGIEPVAPLTPILTCPEPTFEGLCNLYQTGWPGLGLFSDEGGQFVGGHALSVDSRLRTIAGLSTLWDGAAIKRVRAAKDGSYVLPGRRLAMHLMLQPGVAAGLLSDPILKDQGFLSRLLVSHPPSTTGTRLQRPVKQHTQEWLDFYTNRLLTMLQQHPATVEGKPNELSPRGLRFEPAAQEAWTAYADSVEKQIGAGGKYESIMRFANKLPEHASRIAGVLTLFDDLSSPYLTLDAFSRGVEIANHFADEALRLFDAGMVTPEISVAESLLDWLLAKWTEPYIGLSSIYQRGPNAIRDAKAAKAAVNTLVEHGWLVKAPAGTMVGGRAVKEAWQIIRLAS